MGAFRRVEAEEAGPGALGILIPPGKRTFVILRPRALEVDLVVCHGAGDPRPLSFARDEASAAAQALARLLREGLAIEEGPQVWVSGGGFHLVACPRAPGQPYAPLEGPAPEVAQALRAVLHPEGEQELYFNVRHFGGG
jgi:hypothetical protein